MKTTILVACIASVVLVSKSSHQPTNTKICLTPDCVIAAADIIKRMDLTINPCDDFYEFTCGQYIKNTIIPDDKSFSLVLASSSNIISHQLKDILDELQSNETKPFISLKELYEQCLNIEKIEKGSLRDFINILSSIGGWPVVKGKTWSENNMDWKQMTLALRKMGYETNYLITMSAEIDPKNYTGYILTIDEPSLGIINGILTNGISNKVVKTYYKYMVDVAVVLGANRDFANRALKDSLEFEIELAKISLPATIKDTEVLYKIYTMQKFNQKYSYFGWNKYVDDMLNGTGIRIGKENRVNVRNPQYLTNLSNLLKSTPKRTLANYLIWRVVHSSVPYLTQDLRDKQLPLNQILNGNVSAKTRSKECVDRVLEKLPLALDTLYIQKHFDTVTKQLAETMIKDIKNAYADIMKKSEWMDSVTKQHSLEKLAALQPLVVSSNNNNDKTALQKYYSELQLDKKSYLRCILSVNLFSINKNFKLLGKRVNRMEWSEDIPSFEINAVYIAEKNNIQIPAAVLKGSYFNKRYPSFLNYGSVGYILGHEITHGFDNTGRMYDKNGNIHNWWSNKSNDIFEKNTECIINQYNSYTISQLNGTHVNGNLTVNENIADNGGIKNAYFAYQAWVKRNGPEPRLPGLNYTTNQLFWISAANVWCGKYLTEFANTNVLQDTHSLARFRVIGPFSNLKEFAEDFKCPLGSKMNPSSKCQIW